MNQQPGCPAFHTGKPTIRCISWINAGIIHSSRGKLSPPSSSPYFRIRSTTKITVYTKHTNAFLQYLKVTNINDAKTDQPNILSGSENRNINTMNYINDRIAHHGGNRQHKKLRTDIDQQPKGNWQRAPKKIMKISGQLINSLTAKVTTSIRLLTKKRTGRCRINSSIEKVNHVVQTLKRTRIALPAMMGAAGTKENTDGIKDFSSLWYRVICYIMISEQSCI